MIKTNLKQYIEKNTLIYEASGRGGEIEIDLKPLLMRLDEPKMTAYQNYLGGGMLGSIQTNCNFKIELLCKSKQAKIYKMADALARYFHDLTNHDGDEWESTSFEGVQARSRSSF
jgi:hypothetical protein